MKSNIPPIQHLLRQVELYKQRRERRDHRPEWLMEFIDRAAELFDPVDDVARVGFDCRFEDPGWRTCLFLGQTELIGGRHDGHCNDAAFSFDAQGLLALFQHVESVELIAQVDKSQSDSECDCGTWLSVTGVFHDERLIVDIRTSAPDQAGPGFRMFPNGMTQQV